MAESDISRTSYRGAQRVAINSAPLNPDLATRTEAADPHSYLPLVAPGPPPSGFVPPSPPIPTEQQLRERLSAALDAEHQAGDRLAQAGAAHDRAEAHRQRCETALHLFDGLDDQIAADTVQQLVDGDMARVELSDALSMRIGARELTRVSHAAAVQAAEQLARDHAAAREAAAEARRRVDTLSASVLCFDAVLIAEQHDDLLEQAAAKRDVLHAFDHFIGNRHVSLPPVVRAALGTNMSDFAKQRDQTPWREAAARLRADPMAQPEIV